jgi:aldose 1-epimerase
VPITETTVDGLPSLTIDSGGNGGIEATYVPSAGMVACSLRHRGEELLGQRGGLRTYIRERSTMGIPLLYPWANRLGERRFRLAEREVALDNGAPDVGLDPNGLPIHGLLSADDGWRITTREPAEDGGVLGASFDFAARDDLTAQFPFPHTVRIDATVKGPRLTVRTTVLASSAGQVPISFGYHPYLRLPGVDRGDWWIEAPVRERLLLDRRMLPTGERAPVAVAPGRLGARTFDDEYRAPDDHLPFVLSGPDRRIELSLGMGYPYAQVYAPSDDDVVAFEPMTAPTNAFVDGGRELTVLVAGESYQASFSIEVT